MEQKPAVKHLPPARETAAADKATTGAARANSRRPRRATTMDVSYREASDYSESEEPPVLPVRFSQEQMPLVVLYGVWLESE